MDLVYLFRVLLKRKWIIFGAALLAAVIAWYFTRNERYSYRSNARFSTGFAQPDDIQVNSPSSIFDADVKFNNAIATWTSPSVMSLLSYDVMLHDLNSDPFHILTKEQEQTPAYQKINKEDAKKIIQNKLDSMSVLHSDRPEEKKLLDFINLYGYSYGKLGQMIAVNKVGGTDYMQVDCVSDNPDLSAYLVNHSFDQFLRYYRGIRSTKSQESVDTLESIMNKKKQEWEQKNQELRGEGTYDPNQNSSIYDLTSQLERQLADFKNSKIDDINALRKVNQRLNELGSTAVDSNLNSRAEFITAREAVNAAYRTYLNTLAQPDLDRYQTLQKEFNAKYLKAGTGSTATSPTAGSKQDLLNRKSDLEGSLDALDEKINLTDTKINSLKGQASSLSNRGSGLESKMEEVKLAEREYLDAKGKYNLAYSQSSSSVNNFRQLQIAQASVQPEPSKRKILIIMAFMVTFLSAVLIIVLLTYLDSSIKTPVIFSKTVNLKLISMVNFMNLKKKNLREIVAGKIKEENLVEKTRNNVFRESIRKLRFEIENSGKKIILFTSTKKGQGKTTLIQAVAYSMSLSQKKVLIIDTNFCNNDLTRDLGGAPVLEKMASVNGKTIVEQVKDLSTNIGVDNIFIIGSEGGDYTPSEVLPRDNILKHLPELATEFDYIFLEGPPLNDFTDSKELLQYVSGVIGVFSAVHSIKQIDKESINFYKNLNDKFCGSVLNMVDLENVNVT